MSEPQALACFTCSGRFFVEAVRIGMNGEEMSRLEDGQLRLMKCLRCNRMHQLVRTQRGAAHWEMVLD